ncbi:helix-turn-helix transcriptional regulator [Erysipelothrix anatis]|uniref:helix-turn-helix transcriptional regulator n=1 Tax=Erysipelothrix anatis TaxID=2683713 RepID=UPI001915B6E6|nr:helix-turn-helix transcriptional regulator [Erysipelothrix anatis]
MGGHDIKNSKIKALRKAKNLSQIDVANAVGVSRQTIISVENGNYNPTLDLCIRICKLLDVTLNDLFWEEG